jgi:hypothetical protein
MIKERWLSLFEITLSIDFILQKVTGIMQTVTSYIYQLKGTGCSISDEEEIFPNSI